MTKTVISKTLKNLRTWCTNFTLVGFLLSPAACVDYNTNNWVIVSHRVETVAENGTITPGSAYVKHGETATFFLSPRGNYALQQVNGCHGTLSGSSYTIGPVLEDCTITATFTVDGHPVGTSTTTGGRVEPNTAWVEYGNHARFTLIPDTGYHVDSVTGCDGQLAEDIYTTGIITANCTVSVTFRLNDYTLTTTAGPGGTISPATTQVQHGGTTSFTLIPDTGHHIDSVTGCGGTLTGNNYVTDPIDGTCTVSATFRLYDYTLTTAAGAGGTISPATTQVQHGGTTSFTLIPDTGHHIDGVTGCGGTLTGNSYVTGPIGGACTVSATFRLNDYTLTAAAGPGGTISPATTQVQHGGTTSFTLTPDTGYRINNVTGCGGSLSGDRYTTDIITDDCTVDASFIRNPPEMAATPTLTPVATKIFRFTWSDVNDAAFYRLLEDPDGTSGFSQLGTDISSGIQLFEHVVPLYTRINARYLLQSCNEGGCSDALPLNVSGTLSPAIGYFKADKPDSSDWFGEAISLSRDGSTLAIGARYEDSNATGVNGDQYNNSAANAGAVYIFVRNGNGWSQQAYIKADNTGARDEFGSSVSLSDDGNTLAVGAPWEDSSATGVGGDGNDDSAADSGAAYIFTRNGTTWSQQAYIKASNTDPGDSFGNTLSLSGDGNTLAVGARWEDSSASGIDTNGNDNSATDSGSIYLFARSGNTWSQQAYLKTDSTGAGDWFGVSVTLNGNGDTLAAGKLLPDYSGRVYIYTRTSGNWIQESSLIGDNTTNGDQFGRAISLSSDGNTLAAGAKMEDGGNAGINGDGSDNSLINSGAAYVFVRVGGSWSQQAYIKASNPGADDFFGQALALSGDGNTLAVGAPREDSGADGINGDESDNSATGSGAAYVLLRSDGIWRQQAYLKAPVPSPSDRFGEAIALGTDTLAAGSPLEDSNATGVNGTGSGIASASGAAYLY